MGIENDDKIILDQNKKVEVNYKVERYVDVVKHSDGRVERIFHIGRYMLRVSGDGKERKEKPLKIERSDLTGATFDHTKVGDDERDADIKRLTDEEFAKIFGTLSSAQQKEIEKMEKRNAQDAKLAEKQLNDLREKTRLAHLAEEERKLNLIRRTENGVAPESLVEKDEKTIRKLSEITRIGLESGYTDPRIHKPVNNESLKDLQSYRGKIDKDATHYDERRIVIPKRYVPKEKEEDVEFDLNSVKKIKTVIEDKDLKFTKLQNKDITEIEGIDEKTRKAIELSRLVASGQFKEQALNIVNVDDIKPKEYNPDNDPLNAKDAAKEKLNKKAFKLSKKEEKAESKKKQQLASQSISDDQLYRYYDDEEKLKKELARRQKLQEKEDSLIRKREAKEIREKIAQERKAAIEAAKEAEREEKERIAAEQKQFKEAYYQSEEYLSELESKEEDKAAKKAEKEARRQAKLDAKIAAKEEREFKKLEEKSAMYAANDSYNDQIVNSNAEEEAEKQAILAEKQARLAEKLAEKEEIKARKEEERLAKKLAKLEEDEAKNAYLQSDEYLQQQNEKELERQAMLDEKAAKLALKNEEKEIKRNAKLEAKIAKKQAMLEDSYTSDSSVVEINTDFSDEDKYDYKAAKYEAKLTRKQAKLAEKEAKRLAKAETKEAKSAYLHSEDYLDNLEQQKREKQEALAEKALLKEEKRILAEEKRLVKLEQKTPKTQDDLGVADDLTELIDEKFENEDIESNAETFTKEDKKLAKLEAKEAKKQAKLDEKIAKAALEAEVEAERLALENERLKREAIKNELAENEENTANLADSLDEEQEVEEKDDLSTKSVSELKKIAKSFDVENYSKLSKDELIAAIEYRMTNGADASAIREISPSERAQKLARIKDGNRDIIEDAGSRYTTTKIDKKIEEVGNVLTEEIEQIISYSEAKRTKEHSDSYYRLVLRGIIEDEVVHSNVYSNKTTEIIKVYAKEIKKLIGYKSKFDYFVVFDGTIDTHDHHFSCGTAFIPLKLNREQIRTILNKKLKKASDVETLFVTIYPITPSKKRVIVIAPNNPKLYSTVKIIHDELHNANIKHIEDFVANYSDNYFINNTENSKLRNEN